MGTADIPNSPDTDSRRILLIGDIDRAFLDADAVRSLPCEVCGNMLDGIDAAARNDFRAFGVVMFNLSGNLSSTLKALRQTNPTAKIVLLTQMYEEPIAIKLVGSAGDIVNDYLICPVQANRFYEFVTLAQAGATPGIAQPAVIDNVTEMKIKQLEKLATTDELTGLKNRRYIWEFSRQIIEHAKKENGQMTLLMFDIDNFKYYNDVYGHSAGDDILRQAAVLMQRTCRNHDVVGRIGGDEFAVIFWDEPKAKPIGPEAERRSAAADHPNEPVFIAKRFRKQLKKERFASLGPEGKGVLTISGGLASFPRDGSTIQQLFEQADKALLEAKGRGKNRIYLVGTPQNDIADIE